MTHLFNKCETIILVPRRAELGPIDRPVLGIDLRAFTPSQVAENKHHSLKGKGQGQGQGRGQGQEVRCLPVRGDPDLTAFARCRGRL